MKTAMSLMGLILLSFTTAAFADTTPGSALNGVYRANQPCHDNYSLFTLENEDSAKIFRLVADSKWIAVEPYTGNGFVSYQDAIGFPLGTSSCDVPGSGSAPCQDIARYEGTSKFVDNRESVLDPENVTDIADITFEVLADGTLAYNEDYPTGATPSAVNCTFSRITNPAVLKGLGISTKSSTQE